MKKILLIFTLGFFFTTVAVANNPVSSNTNLLTNELNAKAFSDDFTNLSVEQDQKIEANTTDCGFPVYYQDDFMVGYGYVDCNGYTGSNSDFWNWFLNLFF